MSQKACIDILTERKEMSDVINNIIKCPEEIFGAIVFLKLVKKRMGQKSFTNRVKEKWNGYSY